MSVIGIDFGNESCYVAVAKAGGIETIANDYSLRDTPACVAFAGKNRILGVAAKNQMVTNMNNTVLGFKHFLGRQYSDPYVQKELKNIPYRVESCTDGGIGIRINYLDGEHVFAPEQITAMLFTKLKDTAATALQTQINDCVITVPSFFTNSQRKALLDSASIAGLNVLRLLNETTATALIYGFYKNDFPALEEKPRNVIFVDCGHSALQVSACAFNKGKLKMLSSASDLVGGRDIDNVLAQHFSNEFVTKYKIDPRTNKRAYVRLLAEVEKLKKQMSANSTKLPLNIECFMNDIDVHSSMQRLQMEGLCKDLIDRMEKTMMKCLNDSKLTVEDIYSVEIVGGSSRVPALKQLIEIIFGKTPSTTLNQDEAVSRGAALQCAIMSPAVRVRDFSIVDIQNYSIKARWDAEPGKFNEMEVFPANHPAPFSRQLTIYRREPFNMQIKYGDAVDFPDPQIGVWHVKDVKPNANGEFQEIKLKVRINNNGIVLISSATMMEKKETLEVENSETEVPAVASEQSNEPMETQEVSSEDDDLKSKENDSKSAVEGGGWTQRVKGWFSSDNENKKEKKKKSSTKSIDLLLQARTHGFSSSEISDFIDQEAEMIKNDAQEKARVDARNALEEYVYDIRGKLQESGELAEYINEIDRKNICSELDELENWLYEEGENCERENYCDRLNELHNKTNPIKARYLEYSGQFSAFEELGHAVQMARKVVEQIRAKDLKYDHLTETEILNISEAADKAQKFYDNAKNKLAGNMKTQDPSVKIAEIYQECHTLKTCVKAIINRPKPQAQPPPETKQNSPASPPNEKDTKSDEPKQTTETEMDVEAE